MNWISVEDRLPKEDKKYLVCTKEGWIKILYFTSNIKSYILNSEYPNNGCWKYWFEGEDISNTTQYGFIEWSDHDDEWFVYDVVAWMSLPAPYIEDEDFGALDTMYSEDELRSIR